MTKSHIGKKFDLPEVDEAFLFIVRVPGSNVFMEPYVKESIVPKAVLMEWKTTATTLPNWVKAFRSVVITDASEVTVTNTDFKETKFLADAESFRTPYKKKRGSGEQGEPKDDRTPALREVRFDVHERALPTVGESEELEAVISGGSLGKGGLTRIVSEVESSVITLGMAMKEVAALSQKRFEENERESKAILGILQNLFATLGPTVEIDATLGAPTLWGTTAFIAEDVVRLGGVVVSLEAELKPMSEAIRLAVEAQEKSSASAGSSDKVIKVLSLVMGHVRKVGPELEMLKEGLSRLEADVRAGGAGKEKMLPIPTPDSMESLMTMLKEGARVDDDEIHVDGRGRGLDTSEVLPLSVRKLIADIGRLTADVEALKANAEDTSVKFGGLGLKSLQDCHAWVGANFGEHRYGLVMDPLLMMERIFGGDSADGRDNHLKMLESRVKLKIHTGAEAAAISALAYARPRQFHNGKVAMTTERNASRLSKLPNYKSWNSGGQGVRNYVTKQMNLIQGTVAHDISYTFGRGSGASSQAHGLATMSLNATVTFLTQLLVFVDTLYEKLHVDSRFSADQSWSLTTQILDRICEELYAPKEGVQEAMSIEDPASICSHVLWACLRTHDIMTGYIEHQFENHPTIAAEYVKFLATNSGHDKVDKLEATVKDLKEEVASILNRSNAAVTKADVGTGRCDALKTGLEAVAKRVKTLEDRR